MTDREKVLQIARGYIGTVENYDNNVMFNTMYYGHPVSGSQYPWCCVFIWAIFKEANASNLFYDGKKTALCQTAAEWFKSKGQWYTTPQIGDCVFYKYGSSVRYTDHIGIVEKVNPDGSIVAIEGNTSDSNNRNGGMVMRRTRKSGIVGYGRPKYELALSSPITKPYLYKGVDVSAAQVKVDYNKLKESGVEFAIIKIIRKDLQPDTMFEKHYSGFTSAGIPVLAVYNYSYAATVDKAVKDAQIVLKTLGGRRTAVCLDIEDSVQRNLGEKLIEMINAYQEVIESAGLPFILYTGLAFYNKYIKPWANNLKCKNLWIARYNLGKTVMSFQHEPDQGKKPLSNIIGWQYTSCGRVNGYDGNIDLDIIYKDVDKVNPVIGHNIITRVKTSGSRLNVRNSVKNGAIVDRLLNGSVVDVLAVADGWYKIGDERFVSADYIKSNTLGIITANKLNIRSLDSTKGKVLGIYLKGDAVEILRQSSSGWYLTPKGWISNNYVKLQ